MVGPATMSGSTTARSAAPSWTAYLHMDDVAVKVGQRVETGQRLGTVGSTGLSTACHLHLSLYKDGAGSDPLAYVTRERRS